VRNLGGEADREGLVGLVVLGDDGAGLEGDGPVAVDRDPGRDDGVRLAERRVEVAVGEVVAELHVVGPVVVHPRRLRSTLRRPVDRLLVDVHDRFEDVVVDGDGLECVLGAVAVAAATAATGSPSYTTLSTARP
jgi:hypothetical protein